MTTAAPQPRWPHLARLRFSDAQIRAYHASGIWRSEGFEALAAAHAIRRPDALAFADARQRVTWAELHHRVVRTGTGLRDAGVAPGAVVALRMANSVDHIVLLIAIAAVGAVAFELPPDAGSGQVAEGLARTRARALFSDAPPTDAERAALRDPAVVETGAGAIAAESGRPLPGSDPDAVALLLGTSGTTGTPKIVMRTANASLAMIRNVTSRTRVGARDVQLLAAPLAGGLGYFNGLCTPLEHGCATVLAGTLTIDELLEILGREPVTVVHTVPTILRRLADAAPTAGPIARGVRLVQSGGSYLHAQTAGEIEAAFGCCVVSAYGAVDVGTPTMADAGADDAEHRHTTVGRRYDDPHCELAILDPSGARLPDGAAGEVAMRGPNVALGYYDDPSGTASLFDADGWGHFGDLGAVGEDGYLRIVGRLKEVINRGGRKLSVEEIESHLRGADGVWDVAAVGYADPELGERCAAVIVADSGRVVTLDGLRDDLGRRGVPKRLWPERVAQVDELPLSPQGKVRRRELRESLEQGSL